MPGISEEASKIENDIFNPRLWYRAKAYPPVVQTRVDINSSLFKKNTGKNITDQITETRIRIAQELLQNTILSIKEISERVGYSNQYYFSASFKKITGLSPSAFRADT